MVGRKGDVSKRGKSFSSHHGLERRGQGGEDNIRLRKRICHPCLPLATTGNKQEYLRMRDIPRRGPGEGE